MPSEAAASVGEGVQRPEASLGGILWELATFPETGSLPPVWELSESGSPRDLCLFFQHEDCKLVRPEFSFGRGI